MRREENVGGSRHSRSKGPVVGMCLINLNNHKEDDEAGEEPVKGASNRISELVGGQGAVQVS